MSNLYNSIEELVLELEDDESGLERGRTVALVAGAYRPPHIGHVSMVEQYAQNVDEVVVLVSSALKGNRVIGENTITAAQSQQVWQELLSDRGLSNVRVEVSRQPTRASAILEYIGEGGPLEYGTEVILGVGNSGGSLTRYESMAKQAKRGITVRPVSETMAELTNRPSGEPYKTSDLRKILDEGGDADDFFGADRTAPIRSMLGLDSPLEEMSAMGAGAVQGPAVSDEEEKRTLTREQSKNTIHRQYNELELYNEVLRLLTKKGIIK